MLTALAKTTSDIETDNPAFLRLHPYEMMALIEHYWAVRRKQPRVVPTIAAESQLFRQLRDEVDTAGEADPSRPVWHQLMYAYMIENTRIYEIFRRVLHEYLHGEKLGVPLPGAEDWLRSTEAIWYSDLGPSAATPIRTEIRPDPRGSRRNAYQRMFGMDLNHGTDDNQPYRYTRAETSNGEFVTTFEELLREVWVGISNVGNISGQSQTDVGKIGMLADNLGIMLRSRRGGNNLLREEYVAVSMMSWLELAVDSNTPIVQSLRAEAGSQAERLFKIASKVGLPAHALSHSYFELARPLSNILTMIEAVHPSSFEGQEKVFYDKTVGQSVPDAMSTIITHWSIITGRDMKARKVATT
jgi:hypothetical protein